MIKNHSERKSIIQNENIIFAVVAGAASPQGRDGAALPCHKQTVSIPRLLALYITYHALMYAVIRIQGEKGGN